MKSPTFRAVGCLLLLVGLPLFAADRDAARSRQSNEVPQLPPGGADYVLQPQDLIRVYVFQEEDINKQGEVSISNDYTITLPLIGTINVRGKTQRQAEEMIRQLYDKDYLVNPTVTVTVIKYADRSVNIIGAVTKQGRVQFPQEKGLTILGAIALADGFTRLAELKRVKLTRIKPDGEPDMIEVDVDAIRKGSARDVQLQVGDAIFVPERIL